MEIFKTILSSWPLAAVIIVFALRTSLKKIIEIRLSSFKVGNFEFTFEQLAKDFDENYKEAEEAVNKIIEPNVQDTSEVEKEKNEHVDMPQVKKIKSKPIKIELHDYEEIHKLAGDDPERLIRRSWNMVKDQIREVAEQSIVDYTKGKISDTLYELEDLKIIPSELSKALADLHRMFILLLFSKELKSGSAVAYFFRCERAVDQLRKLTY